GGLDRATVHDYALGGEWNGLHLKDQFGRLGRDLYYRPVHQCGPLPGFGGNGVSGWFDAAVGVGREFGDVGGQRFGQSWGFLRLFGGHDAKAAADVGVLRDATSDRCEHLRHVRRFELHGGGFLQVLHRPKTWRVPCGGTGGRHLFELSECNERRWWFGWVVGGH